MLTNCDEEEQVFCTLPTSFGGLFWHSMVTKGLEFNVNDKGIKTWKLGNGW
jgi:hypothetical protein